MAKQREYIGGVEDCPAFWTDNYYIKRGYRINFSSTSRMLRTMFMWHNESVNVWSHLLGAILFLVLLRHTMLAIGSMQYPAIDGIRPQNYTFVQEAFQDKILDSTLLLEEIENQEIRSNIEKQIQYLKERFDDNHRCPHFGSIPHQLKQYIQTYLHNVTEKVHQLKIQAIELFPLQQIKSQFVDFTLKLENQIWPKSNFQENTLEKWPIYVAILGITTCLLWSTCSHQFAQISPTAYDYMAKLDYAGIAILMDGCAVPIIYYVFYCTPLYIWSYIIATQVACITVFVITLLPQFQNPTNKTGRGLLFCGLGFAAASPIAHIFISWSSYSNFEPILPYLVVEAVIYLIGLGFYLSHWPERSYPCRFDIIGSSHQIWHMCILAASIWHWYGTMIAYDIRQEFIECEI